MSVTISSWQTFSLWNELGRLPLLHDVAEGLPSPRAKGRESDVTGRGSTDESFEEVFLAYYGRIVVVLRRLLGDWGRAEDLANEVFLKLYRRPLPQGSDSNVPGWLYRTAMNLGIDALRSSARRKQYEQAAAVAVAGSHQGEDSYDQALRAERQQRVRTVLADLRPSQAQLLVLRASGHSYKEVADALGIEPGSVGTLLVRAEGAFEERYRELYGSEEGL
jgi:RNA polymerase sigma-70 factor (ECF subfamily)